MNREGQNVMTNQISRDRKSEAGLAFWRILLLIVLIGLVAAVVMKLMTAWVALGLAVLATIVIGVLANFSDITRYIKISSM